MEDANATQFTHESLQCMTDARRSTAQRQQRTSTKQSCAPVPISLTEPRPALPLCSLSACRRGFFCSPDRLRLFVHLLGQRSLANGSRPAWHPTQRRTFSHLHPTLIHLHSTWMRRTDASQLPQLPPITPYNVLQSPITWTAFRLHFACICLPHIPRPCLHPTGLLFIIHHFWRRGRLLSLRNAFFFDLESRFFCGSLCLSGKLSLAACFFLISHCFC